MQRISPEIKDNSRRLRKNMTDVERMLWAKIRGHQLQGYGFRRQHPIGHYIVDFVCLQLKLIVELDGSQHLEQEHSDKDRTLLLESYGYQILRFWNNDVVENIEAVLVEICRYLPPPQPSLKGEGY